MKTALRWEEVLKTATCKWLQGYQNEVGAREDADPCVHNLLKNMFTNGYSFLRGLRIPFSVLSSLTPSWPWVLDFYPQRYFPSVFPSHRHFQPLIGYHSRTSAILSNLPVFYLILLEIKILFVTWFLELLELWGERTVFFVLNTEQEGWKAVSRSSCAEYEVNTGIIYKQKYNSYIRYRLG